MVFEDEYLGTATMCNNRGGYFSVGNDDHRGYTGMTSSITE